MSRRTIEDLLRQHNINLNSTQAGQHYAICPQCTHQRKPQHQKQQKLSVKIDGSGVCWNCAHCGWSGPPKGSNNGHDNFRATHDYKDASGQYLYTKVRYPKGHDPKCLLARRNGKSWQWGTAKAARVLYRLPDVLAAIAEGKTIAVAEGESDVDALWAAGVPATCSRDGAAMAGQKSKWLKADSERLRKAKEVVVLGDHDDAGYAHQQVTAKLTAAVGPRVRVLRLADHWPNCPQGGDVRDWLEAGHTREELLALMEKAPEYQQQQADTEQADTEQADSKATKRGNPTQAKVLLQIAAEAELFCTPDGVGYADLQINDHRETWPIRSRTFRRWLARRYYERTGGAPSSEARQSALGIIEAQAQHDGSKRAVFVRVASLGGKLYLDLADDEWRAVEIGEDGWRVVSSPPVRFRRSAGMQPLPLPTKGGSANNLRLLLNLQSDNDFVLVVAWLLTTLRDNGPYPIIVLVGEQGSAKSTFSAILRKLIDPNTAPLRTLPRDERDLFIAATNALVIAYDNVSGLPAWLSDALCRLSTGGGFGTRELHTDQDEVLFNVVRPVILNGIEDIVKRPDLADRAIMLTLEPISDEQRRTETEVWAEFEAVHPAVLGALLDGVAHGLRTLDTVKLKKKPRMADFAIWSTACEDAMHLPCSFEEAYDANRAQATETVIENDPVAVALRTLMRNKAEWKGTASDLLQELSYVVGDNVSRGRHWPAAAHVLSGRLRRMATSLRKINITISLGEREGRVSNKLIIITNGAPLTGQ